MKLVKCSNLEVILSVTKASEIHDMITVALAMTKPYSSGMDLDPEGVSFTRKGVPGFSLYIYNSNRYRAGALAIESYKAAKAALRA